jgi:hypothetical protein
VRFRRRNPPLSFRLSYTFTAIESIKNEITINGPATLLLQRVPVASPNRSKLTREVADPIWVAVAPVILRLLYPLQICSYRRFRHLRPSRL